MVVSNGGLKTLGGVAAGLFCIVQTAGAGGEGGARANNPVLTTPPRGARGFVVWGRVRGSRGRVKVGLTGGRWLRAGMDPGLRRGRGGRREDSHG